MININNQVIYVTELFANLILGQQDSLARQANVIQIPKHDDDHSKSHKHPDRDVNN